jgi:hypothetical protein
MSSTENMQILQQLESGQVSVEDAIGLMASSKKAPSVSGDPATQRWLRVRVTDLNTGKRKVSVNIPLKLMKWGFRFGSRFAPELQDVDLEDLVADLEQHAEGRLVEVEDEADNQRVEIFFE